MQIYLNNKIIIDLGTYRGCSALAFSYNLSNTVHTFDVEYDYRNCHYTDLQDSKIMSKSNIIRHIENIFTENINDESKKLLLESDIIFMDAGDHTGKTYENFLISFLLCY